VGFVVNHMDRNRENASLTPLRSRTHIFGLGEVLGSTRVRGKKGKPRSNVVLHLQTPLLRHSKHVGLGKEITRREQS